MATPGPRTVYRYSANFKATAVRLSQLPGVRVSDVADSLCIHPFMLSKWRKQAREGLILTKGTDIDKDVAAELKELRKLKKDYERLKLEHDLLKKAIAFTSGRKVTSSPSSNTARKRSR
ncbi:MAG: transposase [Planctomycetaceae bacterium]